MPKETWLNFAFHDPWGNRVQLVEYSEIQFTKANHVLEGMGLYELEKGLTPGDRG